LGEHLDAEELRAAGCGGRCGPARCAAPEDPPAGGGAARAADFGWGVFDATGWSAGRLDEALGAAARHSFDLASELSLRATLFRLADDEHVLVAVVHHIAADGWSITPLIRDLGVAYASRCRRLAPGWAPLPVQYVDYTLWQRALLGDLDDGDGPIAAQLAYRARGSLAPRALKLPTDQRCPAVADRRGAAVVDWPASCRRSGLAGRRVSNATTLVVQAAGGAPRRSAPAPRWPSVPDRRAA
jgi:hypothetical protein